MSNLAYGTFTITNLSVVTSVDVYYYSSTSSTSLSGGSWQTTTPTWTNGKYIWSKTVTTWEQGVTTQSEPVCITGQKGSTGSTGQSVTSIVEQYALSTSNTTAPTTGWSNTMPTFEANKYYWTRSKITWANPTNTTYTDAVLANGITSANTTANAANTTAAQANQTANTANQTANAASQAAAEAASAAAAAQSTANTATSIANGKNTIYYGANFPAGGTYKAGDTFFKQTAEGYIIYKYDTTDNQWVKESLDEQGITQITNAKIANLDGGKINAGTITSLKLSTDAIKSRNYQSGTAPYSAFGTFLDLTQGNIYTPNFGVNNDSLDSIDDGAYIRGSIYAHKGTIGQSSTNYWYIGNYKDYNQVNSAMIKGYGTATIQLGESNTWRLNTNRIHTAWNDDSSANEAYRLHYLTRDSKYWDMGLHVPTAGIDKFIYIRSSKSDTSTANILENLQNSLEDNLDGTNNYWTYKFFISADGGIYARNIYAIDENGNYTLISGANGAYLLKSGGTIQNNLVINGTLQVKGNYLNKNGSALTLQTNLGSTTAGTLTGNTTSAISIGVTGTLPSSSGGTGNTNWNQGGVVYIDDSNPKKLLSTAAGTSGYLLKANGTGAPTWINPATLTVAAATKATQDGDGNVIKTTYLKLSGGNVTGPVSFGDSVSVDDLNAGTLVVTGNASFVNGINTTNVNGGQPIYTVIGTQTATTASWTGNLPITALYDGLTIAYYLPRTSASNVTLNLTLANGVTTGAIPVYVTSTTRMTTHYGAGSTILLTYWSAGSISVNGTATTQNRWTGGDYWDGNTVGEYGGACIAGTNGMARYSLILQTSQNTWESLVTTSTTATNKVKNTSGFLITSPILYQSGNTYTSGQTAGHSVCWTIGQNIDTRYSFNVSNAWSVAGRPLYLVGTISGNLFTLKDTTWWADTLPDTNDGYYYWYVGQMVNAYTYTLHPVHPIYYYNNGIKVLNINTLTKSQVTDALGYTPYNATNPSGYTTNTGTVTSVAASGSGGITIGGSPITTSGTLAIGLNLSTAINGLGEGTSPANRNDYAVVQYAGGGTTTTSYHRRKLSNVFAALNSSDITTALGFTPYNATNPNGYTTNTGTVTSVQVQASSPLQSSTSTAQSSSLNTTISFINQNANIVLAGPSSGSAAAPAFRALVAADIPSLTKSKISDFPTTWALSSVSGADDLKAIEALTGTSGFLKKTAANTWSLDTNTYVTSSGVTSITLTQGTGISIGSSGTAITSTGTRTISLADNYGDTKNPYASKTARYVLAAPAAQAGEPTFRALTNADVGLSNVLNIKQVTGIGQGENGKIRVFKGSGTNDYEDIAVEIVATSTSSVASSQKLTSYGGSATQPVYFPADGANAGKPVAISYTIEKSVPSNAVFTDTWNKVSTSQDGYITKLPGNTTTFLRGDGTWGTPGGTYSLPLAANGTRGGVQIGYSSSGKNYAVQLSSQKMYVNVPWTDTTYSAGTGLSLSGTTFNHSNSITAGGVGTSNATNGATLAVPYIMYDAQGHVTSSGTHTHTINNIPQADITWGGPALSGNASPNEVATIDDLAHNKFAFMSAASVAVHYSRDGGSTWVSYGTDDEHRRLVTLSAGFQIGGPEAGKSATVNDQLRVQLNANIAGGNVYCNLRRILIYLTTSGSSGCTCTVQYKTIANYNNNNDTWTTTGTYNVSGWSGWNSIPFSGAFGGGSTQTGQIAQIRLIFKVTGVSSSYTNLAISSIRGIAFPLWTSPSTMASTGHLYTFDINQNATFPAQITATQFNGLATKATGDKNGADIATTYLKLAGGTMTGVLTTKSNMYTDAYNSGALNLGNSNIDGVNSIYTADASENAAEGIHFYRDSTHVDSLYAKSGVLYFTPNRALGNAGTDYSVYHTGNKPSKSDVGLSNVENTALSTWAGSSNIITLGTISSGTIPWARLSDIPNYAGSSSKGGAATSLAGFTNTTTSATAIDNATQNGHVYVNGTSTGTNNIYGISDGAAFVQAYSTSWVAQIYQDYRTGQIALRGKNNGTWQAWRKVLDSTSYTDYTVKKDGTGASGDWGISITGNAATATKATQDGSGNTIINTYIKKAGDSTTGGLAINASNSYSSYNEGLRINAGARTYATLLLGGTNNSTAGTNDGAFWLGVYNTSSYTRRLMIAHNGSTATSTYFYASSASQVSPALHLGTSGTITSGNADAVTGGTVYTTLSEGYVTLATEQTISGRKTFSNLAAATFKPSSGDGSCNINYNSSLNALVFSFV